MRKVIIYTAVALLIVLVGGFVAFFLINNGATPEDTPQEKGFFGSLFPFGNGLNGDTSETALVTGEIYLETGSKPVPRLREVSASPVSGGYIYEKDGVVMIRFVDRASGNVYETEAESTTIKRITNTTIPGIQEVLWANENEFIIRYLNVESVESFYVSLDPETEQSLGGEFIDQYKRGVIDSSGENLFVVSETTNGSELILSSTSGGNARTILTSPIKSWIPLQSDNGLFVYPAPTAGVSAALYKIANGFLTKVTSETSGFTAQVSTDGNYALVGLGDVGALQAALINMQTNNLYPIVVETLPEKCVFDPTSTSQLYCAAPQFIFDASYPDDWLLGSVSFSDDIWFVEPLDGIATFITDGSEVNELFDVWQPKISPDGSHFIFINKKDLSLWSLRLTENE